MHRNDYDRQIKRCGDLMAHTGDAQNMTALLTHKALQSWHAPDHAQDKMKSWAHD